MHSINTNHFVSNTSPSGKMLIVALTAALLVLLSLNRAEIYYIRPSATTTCPLHPCYLPLSSLLSPFLSRHKLRQLDSSQTHGSLQLLHLCMLRTRHMQVYQKLKLIATVQQTQPTIQLLLSTSDFVGALDLITVTQEVLQTELQGVHSLRCVAGVGGGGGGCPFPHATDELQVVHSLRYIGGVGKGRGKMGRGGGGEQRHSQL